MTEPSVPLTEGSPFERVMQEHSPRVTRALRYLGVAEPDLPDASQEVFLVVHRRLQEFRGEASLGTWIYEICVRLARAWRRRAAARRDAPVAELPAIGIEATQESALQVAQARHRLLKILDELPEEQRAVVVLHELEEVRMAEVATLLGCPLFTAYSRLRLARRRLEQLLTQQATEVEYG